MIASDRLSLVVGVAGHRDVAPEDEAPLRAAFGGVIDELRRGCRHSPLIVLSSLAAGADTFAAEEAIGRGVPVIACLPMPVEEYERDFSPAQLPRFRSTLAKCDRVIVTSSSRERGYVAAASFVAQFSHVLVAFWDGRAGRGAGGTADAVRMRITRAPHGPAQDMDVPYMPDIGPVYHIVTPHGSGPRPADAFAVTKIHPQRFHDDRTAERDFGAILSHIDTYNADLSTIPAPPGEPRLEAFVERTDAVANRLQARTAAFQIALFACAFLAAAAQIVGRFAIVKVIALAVAFVAYRVARTNDYENRYQDYRALAEALRVQNVWHNAGLRHRLADKAYLSMQEGELQWIRMALRSLYLLCCEARTVAGARYSHPVCRAWLRSQWRYYREASRTNARSERRLDIGAKAALGIGFACSAVALLALALRGELLAILFPPNGGAASADPTTGFFTVLLTAPLALAAILGAIFAHYSEKQNYAANARRYERMFHVVDRARRRLPFQRTPDRDGAEVLFDVGHAALVEHADWLIMRRERPLKVVVV